MAQPGPVFPIFSVLDPGPIAFGDQNLVRGPWIRTTSNELPLRSKPETLFNMI